MSTSIFNQEALVSVEIMDRKPVRHFEWHPAYKKWYGSKPERFEIPFLLGDASWYTPDHLREHGYMNIPVIVDGKKVYEFPRVRQTYAGGKVSESIFDTYEEALAWGREQADKGIRVQLLIRKD